MSDLFHSFCDARQIEHDDKLRWLMSCSLGGRVQIKNIDKATNIDKVFEFIDTCTQHNFYMLTGEPKKLAEKWTARNRKDCIRCDGDGCDPEDWRGRPKYFMDPDPCRDCYRRPNVIIGVHVTTQAEADRLIPELLKLSGLCRGLWVDLRGQTEEITFRWAKWQPFGTKPGDVTDELDGLRKIHFVTIGGIDKPVHPQWLRTIRDQCKAADVKCWFDGWGDWLPIDEYSPFEHGSSGQYEDINLWPSGDRKQSLPSLMFKVGSTRSGHKLDGEELRETIE